MIEKDWTNSDRADAYDAEENRNWWRKVRSDPDGSVGGWPDECDDCGGTDCGRCDSPQDHAREGEGAAGSEVRAAPNLRDFPKGEPE